MLDFKGFYSRPYRWLHQHPECLGQPGLWAQLEQLQAAVPANEKHWEFVAMALLHTAGYRAGQTLPDTLLGVLKQLYGRMATGHKAANWRLMRRITQCAVDARVLAVSDLEALDMAQHANGFLPDAPDDCSTQYHAYNALLLARFADRQDASMREVLRRALAWLVEAALQDGEPNARGRGTFQLFGYAAMDALADLLVHEWGLGVPQDWWDAVRARMEHYEGSGALPLWWNSPAQQHWLLGYNSCDDYPAFADFWAPTRHALPTSAAEATSRAIERWTCAESGDGAYVVFSDERGPVVALQPVAATGRPSVGVKSALKALVRSVRQRGSASAAAHEPQSRKLELMKAQVGPWHLSLEEGCLVAQWSLASPVASAPVLWVRSDFAVRQSHETQGSVDAQHLSWEAADGTPRWNGLAVRAVRHGSVRVVYELMAAEVAA